MSESRMELTFESKTARDAFVEAALFIASAVRVWQSVDVRTDAGNEENHWLVTIAKFDAPLLPSGSP
jgi:hypothetical protein